MERYVSKNGTIQHKIGTIHCQKEQYETKLERYKPTLLKGKSGRGFELKNHRAVHIQRDKYWRCPVVLFNQYSNRMKISERIISSKPRVNGRFGHLILNALVQAGPGGAINFPSFFLCSMEFLSVVKFRSLAGVEGEGTHYKISSQLSYQGYETLPG